MTWKIITEKMHYHDGEQQDCSAGQSLTGSRLLIMISPLGAQRGGDFAAAAQAGGHGGGAEGARLRGHHHPRQLPAARHVLGRGGHHVRRPPGSRPVRRPDRYLLLVLLSLLSFLSFHFIENMWCMHSAPSCLDSLPLSSSRVLFPRYLQEGAS